MATLRIYDISIDDYRDATQVDLDQLQEVANAYAQLRSRMAEDHAALQDRLRVIRSKAGVPV
jgi:predicted transcriptional regulator